MELRNTKLEQLFYIYHRNLKYRCPMQYLTKRGFNLQDLLSVGGGLAYLGEKQWLNLSLYNFNNQLVGFLSRKVGFEKKFLYLPINKPPSKSESFLGLKHLPTETNTIYLVEGDFDWLAFRKGGILNCLPLCGLTLSDKQMKFFQQSKIEKVVLCLDNDFAGKVAAANLERILKNAGFQVKVVQLKGKVKDWNELLLLYPKNWAKALRDHLAL
ncbi:DNA primase-like protein [Mycoplasmoides pneumoniae]|uniref:Uncharacterized protein MG010 homolog n=4 Tax=Mycoplasmoides pneumoniae TaxID=2104 RepID=Y014_MYCPN|nr:DNA primase-like protein [Mycoplasmoides pneumoniae]P75099.1 RecName: Full=Uncharacterized protein MG010 homolog [Mycoplasmoides pneumoniae M129]AAB95788.1 conserved hypothetical protein [Mycoplasmoides pneumoniae M129]AGC03958.1 hypothetical protein C985_0014 [Mycoplasmoides pneumoniae M129-B7]ALA30863.1 hypothetical protein B434_01595 [Mycoplasmoides pneumoniae 19294]ALA35531.1 hypothetical protein F539_00075 [Mycoplasmoides pneumoniae FH]ALA36236.1 hypothetical protein F538_00075 [Mycop